MATPTPSLPEGLPPHELRNAMRKVLKDTLDRMDSDEFVFELETMGEEERNAAMITRGEIFRAWRKLNNQQLDEIRDQLVENEVELAKATESLNAAVEDLGKVETILNSANMFLMIASKALTIL